MKVKLIDTNKTLIDLAKVKLPQIESIHGNIFDYEGVLVSASNPWFSFTGSLEAEIYKRFPAECEEKKKTPGVNKRIGNIIFVMSVNKELKATPINVSTSLRMAFESVKPHETLLLTGLGTGIGGMSEGQFIRLLRNRLIKTEPKYSVFEDLVKKRKDGTLTPDEKIRLDKMEITYKEIDNPGLYKTYFKTKCVRCYKKIPATWEHYKKNGNYCKSCTSHFNRSANQYLCNWRRNRKNHTEELAQ